jgi:hypothetical protein
MPDPTFNELTWTDDEGRGYLVAEVYGVTAERVDRPATLADVAKAIEARGLRIADDDELADDRRMLAAAAGLDFPDGQPTHDDLIEGLTGLVESHDGHVERIASLESALTAAEFAVSRMTDERANPERWALVFLNHPDEAFRTAAIDAIGEGWHEEQLDRLRAERTAAEGRAGRAEGELAAALVTIGDDARRYVELDRALTLATDERDAARSKLIEVERDGAAKVAEYEAKLTEYHDRIAELINEIADVARALRVARGVSDGSADNTKRLYGENASLRSQLESYRTVVEAALSRCDEIIDRSGEPFERSIIAQTCVDVAAHIREALDALPATESPRPEARCHDECGDHGFHCMRPGCPGIAGPEGGEPSAAGECEEEGDHAKT